MSRLTRDGTAEPVSRDQFSADHEQDWQPYPVDPYSFAIFDDQTYIELQVYKAQHVREQREKKSYVKNIPPLALLIIRTTSVFFKEKSERI